MSEALSIPSAFTLRRERVEMDTSGIEPPLGKLETDQETVATFEGYFNGLTSGDPNLIRNTRAKLQFQFRRIGSNSFLFDDLGDPVIEQGDYIPEKDIPKIDEDQRVLLLEFADLASNPQFADEVRNLLAKYAKSGDKADIDRLNLLLAERKDQPTVKIEDFVKRFDSFRRQLKLKQDFYTGLVDNESVDQAFTTLNAYGELNPEDISVIADLRDRALGIRRARVTKQFSTALVSTPGDFDQALATLGILAGENSPQEDKDCARILAKALYRLELATGRDQVREMITLDRNPKDIYQFIDSIPARASIDEIDPTESLLDLKERVGRFYVQINRINRLKRANTLRASFSTGDVDSVLSEIEGLPDETQEEMVLKSDLFNKYKTFIAENKPGVFDERFAKEIVGRIEDRLREVFINPELGRNKEAFNYLSENFLRVIFPLVESLRDDPNTQAAAESVLSQGVKDGTGVSKRLKFLQKITELEKQRPLTDVERSYIESVELLTLFNPYLVAAVGAGGGVTGEFLRHHFDTLSRETTRSLKDGDYVPLIAVGTGPNGVTALGELVRNNPELARQTLVIDAGTEPGGPFAIPGGPAWSLNSANRRGEAGYYLPDSPNGSELKTVRSYGSPTRTYPGRKK